METATDETFLQAIAVTAELTGTQLSKPAARLMAADLSEYPVEQVLVALTRCRRELRTRLTVAEVVARLEDGRPGAEQAWSHVSPLLGNEGATIVWTEEEKQAFFACAALDGDPVAARMAFLETYRKLTAEARNEHKPVRWEPCLGHDAGGRQPVLVEAVNLGRITHRHAVGLLPHLADPPPGLVDLMLLGTPAARKDAGKRKKESRMAGEKEKDPSDEPQPKPGDEQREAA